MDWRVSPVFLADVDLEGEYDGSGPSIFLTSRISFQQCSMDFDSVLSVIQGSDVVSLRVCLLPR